MQSSDRHLQMHTAQRTVCAFDCHANAIRPQESTTHPVISLTRAAQATACATPLACQACAVHFKGLQWALLMHTTRVAGMYNRRARFTGPLKSVIVCVVLILQGRGISYTPVTGGFNASQTVTVDQTSACACTSDGKSGSTLLNSRLAGCDQHGLSTGDSEYYCYTQGGTECTTATPSNAYPGETGVPFEIRKRHQR